MSRDIGKSWRRCGSRTCTFYAHSAAVIDCIYFPRAELVDRDDDAGDAHPFYGVIAVVEYLLACDLLALAIALNHYIGKVER